MRRISPRSLLSARSHAGSKPQLLLPQHVRCESTCGPMHPTTPASARHRTWSRPYPTRRETFSDAEVDAFLAQEDATLLSGLPPPGEGTSRGNEAGPSKPSEQKLPKPAQGKFVPRMSGAVAPRSQLQPQPPRHQAEAGPSHVSTPSKATTTTTTPGPSRPYRPAPIPPRRRIAHIHPSQAISKPVPTSPPPAPSTAEADARRTIPLGEGWVEIFPQYLSYHRPQQPPLTITCARLRDSCTCDQCVHPTTRQKLHTSGEAYARVLNAKPAIVPITGAIEVHWPGNRLSKPHRSVYSTARIQQLTAVPVELLGGLKRVLWGGKDLETKSKHLRINFADLHENGQAKPEVLFNVLKQVHQVGLVILEGVPTEATGNEDCSLRTVAEMIGEIRNTFYGETWNVKNMAQSKNVAYTNLDLGLHMDLLYFSNPPRFQLLHCLRNRVDGGASYFVDSFQATRDFSQVSPQLYALLQKTRIPFEYDNDGHYMTCNQPVLLDLMQLHRPRVAVNWSPPFQGTIPRRPHWLENQLYSALHAFDRVLNRPDNKYEFMLKEGDLVLFDNRRVLHARRQFRDWTDDERKERGIEMVEGEPTRWLKGCYLDGDVVWDKLVVLDRQINGTTRGREEGLG